MPKNANHLMSPNVLSKKTESMNQESERSESVRENEVVDHSSSRANWLQHIIMRVKLIRQKSLERKKHKHKIAKLKQKQAVGNSEHIDDILALEFELKQKGQHPAKPDAQSYAGQIHQEEIPGGVELSEPIISESEHLNVYDPVILDARPGKRKTVNARRASKRDKAKWRYRYSTDAGHNSCCLRQRLNDRGRVFIARIQYSQAARNKRGFSGYPSARYLGKIVNHPGCRRNSNQLYRM